MSQVYFSDYANYSYLHYERADVEDEIIPLIRPLLEFRWARGKGVKWGDKFGESAQLSWSIGTTTSIYTDWHYSWDPPINERFGNDPTQEEIDSISKIFEHWSKFANVNFTYVEEDSNSKGNIRVIFIDMGSTGIAYLAPDGEFHINNNLREDLINSSNRFAEHIVSHEIGHAVFGLNDVSVIHGWDEPNGDNGKLLPWHLNNHKWTVMSYMDVGNIHGISPMILDILAVQKIYGPNNSTGEGDTIYRWDESPFETIWDVSGNDTIDLSNFNDDINFQTEDGNLIEIGEKNIVGIAFNVDIENFIGGNGNDYYYLSEKVISVNSNGGDDLIFAENDISNVIIDGGGGTDILVSYKSSYSQNFENLVNHTNQGLEILSNNNTALNLANYDIDTSANKNKESTIYLSAAGLDTSERWPTIKGKLGQVYVPIINANSKLYSNDSINGLDINPLGHILKISNIESINKKIIYTVTSEGNTYTGELNFDSINKNNNYKFDLTSSSSDVEIIDLTGDDTLEISIRNLSNIENAYYLGKDLILNFNVDGNNSKINIQNHKTYGTIENIVINTDVQNKTYQLLPESYVPELSNYFKNNNTNGFEYDYDLNSFIVGDNFGEGIYASPNWLVDEYIFDTKGDDLIFGNSGSDDIGTSEGNDIVFSGEGNDRIIGSKGNDEFYGGEGNDYLYGEDWNENEHGNDKLYGNDGDDTVRGEGGNDVIYGGNGNDILEGDGPGATRDNLSGKDKIYGEDGEDRIWGHEGDDIINGGSGNDYIDGGSGNDTAIYTGQKNDYLITGNYGDYTVQDLRPNSPDGTDTLFDIEIFKFGLSDLEAYNYIASNTDLISAFGIDIEAAKSHYTNYGILEGRSLTLFSASDYLAKYSDLSTAFGDDQISALKHYIEFGFSEGRTNSVTGSNSGSGFSSEDSSNLTNFQALNYIASYGDLIIAFGADTDAARSHYTNYGKLEGRSLDDFDEWGYLASNNELINAYRFDPMGIVQHYISFGYSQGKLTNSFDAQSYLNNYADLRNAFGNDQELATKHYVEYGFNEGRVF